MLTGTQGDAGMDDALAERVRGATQIGRVPLRWAVHSAAAGLGLLILCAVALPGPARAEDQLRVLTGGSIPPFMYYDASGAATGFEIDIANALCTILAMRCVFIDMPFEKTIPALIAGRGDAIMASMSITEERKKLVAFTNRYYRTPMQFIARKGFARPLTPEGLRGLKIGMNADTTEERYAREHFGATAEIIALPGGTQDNVNRALIQGRIDLELADLLVIWQFTASPEGRDFTFVGQPIYVDDDIGIAVRKEDEALRQRLNAAIARIRLDGTYRKINAKYFPFSIY